MSQAKGKENLAKFTAFVTERDSDSDWEDFVALNGLELNKTQIAKVAGLASRKVITDNKEIFALFKEKQKTLVDKGVLSADTRSNTEKAQAQTSALSSAMDSRRSKKIAETNAALQEQLYAITKENEQLKTELTRFKKIQDYMESTGRW